MTDIITGPGFYTTFDGQKVEILAVAKGWALGLNGTDNAQTWRACDGKWDAQVPSKYHDQQDIKSPWIDPPPARHECWVNIYDHGSLGYRNGGSVFTSSKRADGILAPYHNGASQMAFTIQHTSTAFGYPVWHHVGGDVDYQAAAKKAYKYAMEKGGYVCVKDADGKTCFGTDPITLDLAILAGRNRDFLRETARRQGC